MPTHNIYLKKKKSEFILTDSYHLKHIPWSIYIYPQLSGCLHLADVPEAWHELLDDATSIPGSRTWVFWSMEGLGRGGTLKVAASRRWRPICSPSARWFKETHQSCTLSQVVIVHFWFTVIWVLRKKKNSFFSAPSCQNAKCCLFLIFSATVK